MSRTVVRLTNCKVKDEVTADQLCNKIEQELEDRGYRTTDVSIGDSKNMDGEVLLRAVTHHKLPSEADAWAGFLRKFVEAYLGDEIESAVVDEHDCQHFENGSEPCKPVKWVYGG